MGIVSLGSWTRAWPHVLAVSRAEQHDYSPVPMRESPPALNSSRNAGRARNRWLNWYCETVYIYLDDGMQSPHAQRSTVNTAREDPVLAPEPKEP